MEGIKPVGKPRKRWKKQCEGTPPNCSIRKKWRATARYGSDWRKKAGVAMARRRVKEP